MHGQEAEDLPFPGVPELPTEVPNNAGPKITKPPVADLPVVKQTVPISALPIAQKQEPVPKGGAQKPPAQIPPGIEMGPAPKEFRPFGPLRPRLPAMAGGPQPLGTTPQPDEKTLQKFNKYVKEFVDPENNLPLVQGRARLMILKQTPKRIQIVDENIASYTVITPKEITILGRNVGTTVLNFWFTDPNDADKERVLSYLVNVIPDPEEKERLERAYGALTEEINKAFPDSVISIKLVGDKLLVAGQAKDIVDATQILRIVRANAPPEDAATIPVQSLQLTVPPTIDPTAPGGVPGLEDFLTAGGPNVINMIRIGGEQQVMLRVTVAEVNRSAIRSIGLNLSVTNNNGVTVFQNRTGNIASGGAAGIAAGAAGALGGGLLTNNLPAALDNGQIQLAINALRTLNYAKSLAEPNLVALNGRTASFLAGGQFPVPVVTGFTAAGLQGVGFVPFGVQLSFTPFVTDKDRIRLNVAATVSTRDSSTGTNIGGANIAGLNTRNFTTTVELREGETMAVAGLIQNNLGADATRVPFIGDLPVFSRLTGFDRLSAGEQELIILVTPELVRPLADKQNPALPGFDLLEPGDFEFYLLGRMESHQGRDYRSPIRNDMQRRADYRRGEAMFLYGPTGYDVAP